MKTAHLARQPTDQRILFLDFDGVLHPEGIETDLEFVDLDNFEHVIREFQQVRIVVSPTWRLSESVEELRLHFSADIRERIVDVTPKLADFESVRGQRHRECEAWIRENSPDGHGLALDDGARYFDDCNPRFRCRASSQRPFCATSLPDRQYCRHEQSHRRCRER